MQEKVLRSKHGTIIIEDALAWFRGKYEQSESLSTGGEVDLCAELAGARALIGQAASAGCKGPRKIALNPAGDSYLAYFLSNPDLGSASIPAHIIDNHCSESAVWLQLVETHTQKKLQEPQQQAATPPTISAQPMTI